MKKRLKLVINVTRDKQVHGLLERGISAHKNVAAMFDRVYISGREELMANIPLADVLLTFAVPEDAISRAPNLKWVHFASAGVEKSLNKALLRRKIKLSNSSGIHAASIAEYVIMQILAFSKNYRKSIEFQKQHQWQFEGLLDGRFDLEGKTITIIGLGAIGRRVARLAKAFDMKVIGTVNTVRPLKYVDKVYAPSKLDTCIKQADFVILSAPVTKQTFHLIGQKQLSIMKPRVLLVNIGRGKLIDESALIDALRNRSIGGAALDVFEREPLPADSPLWDMENVSVTPHYSGMAERLWEKVADLFCENALRYRDGRRLLNTVDKKRGY
jgi:D-2-hydroxyacid dehydrogenase (NADP+)